MTYDNTIRIDEMIILKAKTDENGRTIIKNGRKTLAKIGISSMTGKWYVEMNGLQWNKNSKMECHDQVIEMSKGMLETLGFDETVSIVEGK